MSSAATRVTATGDVTTGPTTLRLITADITTAGILTLRAGGVGGTVLAEIGMVAGNVSIPITGGIKFNGGIHATFTTLVGGVTFWLGAA